MNGKSKNTIVFVEDRNGCSGLIELLSEHGWSVLRARGPMRLREILGSQEIALIVWEEGPGNQALLEDLALVWQSYDAIPVVHIYSSAQGQDYPDGTFHDSLPADIAGDVLLKLLEENDKQCDFRDLNTVPEKKTELAFRHIWNSLKLKPRTTPDKIDKAHDASDFVSTTALKPSERSLLLKEDPDIEGKHSAPGTFRYVSWLKKLTGG
ncbi:MAG: hypothetical protein OEZ59_05345 [Deltaproteobacteria bacterium]|nr:hypothetical protein [Deltaproteobacteria bacterium]